MAPLHQLAAARNLARHATNLLGISLTSSCLSCFLQEKRVAGHKLAQLRNLLLQLLPVKCFRSAGGHSKGTRALFFLHPVLPMRLVRLGQQGETLLSIQGTHRGCWLPVGWEEGRGRYHQSFSQNAFQQSSADFSSERTPPEVRCFGETCREGSPQCSG